MIQKNAVDLHRPEPECPTASNVHHFGYLPQSKVLYMRLPWWLSGKEHAG